MAQNRRISNESDKDYRIDQISLILLLRNIPNGLEFENFDFCETVFLDDSLGMSFRPNTGLVDDPSIVQCPLDLIIRSLFTGDNIYYEYAHGTRRRE